MQFTDLSYVLNYHYTKFELYWDDYFLELFVVKLYAAHSERRSPYIIIKLFHGIITFVTPYFLTLYNRYIVRNYILFIKPINSKIIQKYL